MSINSPKIDQNVKKILLSLENNSIVVKSFKSNRIIFLGLHLYHLKFCLFI